MHLESSLLPASSTHFGESFDSIIFSMWPDTSLIRAKDACLNAIYLQYFHEYLPSVHYTITAFFSEVNSLTLYANLVDTTLGYLHTNRVLFFGAKKILFFFPVILEDKRGRFDLAVEFFF